MIDVRVGQVWKSKDKRETRYVRIDEVREPVVYCLPCNSLGKQLGRFQGRASRIQIVNLQQRYTLAVFA